MASRKLSIGIIFNFSKNWFGGVNYIVNIIKTMNTLPLNEKPKLTVFYAKQLSSELDKIKGINYENIKFKELNYCLPRSLNYLLSVLFNKNYFFNGKTSSGNILFQFIHPEILLIIKDLFFFTHDHPEKRIFFKKVYRGLQFQKYVIIRHGKY